MRDSWVRDSVNHIVDDHSSVRTLRLFNYWSRRANSAQNSITDTVASADDVTRTDSILERGNRERKSGIRGSYHNSAAAYFYRDLRSLLVPNVPASDLHRRLNRPQNSILMFNAGLSDDELESADQELGEAGVVTRLRNGIRGHEQASEDVLR